MPAAQAESKATLESIFRSGVALNPAQSRIVDDVQTRIIELEQSKGVILSDASARMMQPGVVNRDSQPAPAPAAQPAPAPAAQPAPAPCSAPAAAPEATPAAPAAQPTSDAMATDVVAAARKAEAMNLLAEADKAYNSANSTKPKPSTASS